MAGGDHLFVFALSFSLINDNGTGVANMVTRFVIGSFTTRLRLDPLGPSIGRRTAVVEHFSRTPISPLPLNIASIVRSKRMLCRRVILRHLYRIGVEEEVGACMDDVEGAVEAGQSHLVVLHHA